MTAEIAQGLTTGGTIVQGLTTGGMTDQGPTTGRTTTETSDQLDQIPEGCQQERRPAVTQSKTAGTRPAEPDTTELLGPRRRTAITVPSAMPADRSLSLAAGDR